MNGGSPSIPEGARHTVLVSLVGTLKQGGSPCPMTHDVCKDKQVLRTRVKRNDMEIVSKLLRWELCYMEFAETQCSTAVCVHGVCVLVCSALMGSADSICAGSSSTASFCLDFASSELKCNELHFSSAMSHTVHKAEMWGTRWSSACNRSQ